MSIDTYFELGQQKESIIPWVGWYWSSSIFVTKKNGNLAPKLINLLQRNSILTFCFSGQTLKGTPKLTMKTKCSFVKSFACYDSRYFQITMYYYGICWQIPKTVQLAAVMVYCVKFVNNLLYYLSWSLFVYITRSNFNKHSQ